MHIVPLNVQRVVPLDVLRGFALCGILIANVKPIAHRGDGLPAGGSDLVHVLVDQRFFPIFSILFGVGFTLLIEKTGSRVLLARRLAVLLLIGLLHLMFLWRGDVLTVYAAFGLLILLPSTWLPRRVVAVLAAALTALSLTVLGGWYSLVPGLFLTGAALTRYGVVAALDRPSRRPAVLALLCTAAAVPATVLQWRSDPDSLTFRIAYPTAGLLLATVYICTMVALLHTPLRPVLTTLFTPLGRMALTNYLTATVLVLATSHVIPHSDLWPTPTVLTIAGAILTLQWLYSTLWLRRFRQGPLEWLWRWATFLKRPPMQKTQMYVRRGPQPQ